MWLEFGFRHKDLPLKTYGRKVLAATSVARVDGARSASRTSPPRLRLTTRAGCCRSESGASLSSVSYGTKCPRQLDVEGKPVELHEKLLKEAFRFIHYNLSVKKRFRVHVFASDNATVDAVDKASAEFDSSPSMCWATVSSSAPRRKMGQTESNAMTQENNTNESSEPLRIPARWRDKTSEDLGRNSRSLDRIRSKQRNIKAPWTRIFRQRATDRRCFPYVERLRRSAGAR